MRPLRTNRDRIARFGGMGRKMTLAGGSGLKMLAPFGADALVGGFCLPKGGDGCGMAFRREPRMTTNRLTPRSRGLRQSGGLAEDRIWARLRGGAVDGWKMRRQHPVGGYVVDFACVPLRLVIEIDGGVHERDEVVLNDHYRQEAIEAMGWTVVRFTNAEALTDPARIDAALRDRAKTLGL